MRISTPGSVNATKPRSCNNRLPAGSGYGVASAIRLSWTCPPTVSLRKRMISGALTRRTFLPCDPFSCHCNIPSVQQRLGGGRCAVPSRHGQKGGGRSGDWRGGRRRNGLGFFRRRRHDREDFLALLMFVAGVADAIATFLRDGVGAIAMKDAEIEVVLLRQMPDAGDEGLIGPN